MRISRIALLSLALSFAATMATVNAAERATLDRHGAWVSVEAYGPNVVHVTIAADKAQALTAPGYGILADHADGSAFKQTRDAGGDTFASPALTLHVDAPPPPRTPAITDRYFAPQLAPVSLQVKNASGTTVVDMTGWEMSPHEVAGEATYQVGATFTAPADEHYYGMGQNQDSLGPLDLRGRVIDCKHWYDAPGGETVCVPFMVSSRGYGIIWDNPSETRFVAGINGHTRFQSNVGERVSFFVITGDTPEQIYSAYARVTGKTPIPPKAAFGLIQSKARYSSQDEILRVARTYREKNYPLDVMVLDWFYWTRMGQMDINPAEFPDPDGMNRQLHAMGMKSIVSVWPRFERSSRYFKELDDKGYFLKDKNVYLESEVQRRTREVSAVQDVTILAMGSLAETRDNETGNHLRRTQNYVQLLATLLRRAKANVTVVDPDDAASALRGGDADVVVLGGPLPDRSALDHIEWLTLLLDAG